MNPQVPPDQPINPPPDPNAQPAPPAVQPTPVPPAIATPAASQPVQPAQPPVSYPTFAAPVPQPPAPQQFAQAPQPSLPEQPAYPQAPVATPYQQQPAMPSTPLPAPRPVPKVFSLAIMMLAVIGILASSFGAFRVAAARKNAYENLDTTKSQKAIANDTEEVVDRPDENLDLSKKVDSRLAVRAQKLTANLNQQVNLSNGFSFMITGFEENWTDPKLSDFYKPKSGNMLLKVNIVAGNRNSDLDNDFFVACSTKFTAKGADGKAIKSKSIFGVKFEDDYAEDFKGTNSGTSTIEPGDQAKAACIYEAPAGGTYSIFVKESGYKITDTDKGESFGDSEVSLEAEVKLTK